ncbi:hypothetical protein ABE583_14125 [Stenotrophomonas sp. TWI143]|uniref:Uncharacterized protein n=1 Tax=Stenotrophomonas maltophilia TaxID=40324 RepID=A0AAP7GVI3_STEMA|nr:hypothetical protein [Stenotrophomonas maltophilia]MBA0220914.1 hypothetical protein [Stenotrophomonas maltophilia]OBU62237.1 hypothetical protein A9K56_05320 [Stenotrophomonas maltophilia]HDS1218801.1 hypothetical protein [Stenotrophomonas maltophilia]HDS1230466.1 hypothetical protein [Stenotrophomonas maltophilia]HEL3866260.1 hypothetical protein [Stenotrophomonas maltophilia]
MSARPLFPHLCALIGESADRLPADAAERLEALLDDPQDLLPALLARMDGRDGADGRRLDVEGLSPVQVATQAGLGRTLAGLDVLVQVLHAAAAAREQGGVHQQLSPDVVDGLLLGARELVRHARQQVE